MDEDRRRRAGGCKAQAEPDPARACCASAYAGWRWNRELAADRAGGAGGDLAVPRDRSAQVGGRAAPDRVAGALAEHFAAVFRQVALQLAAFQAARSIVTLSTCPPPIGGSRPSSR